MLDSGVVSNILRCLNVNLGRYCKPLTRPAVHAAFAMLSASCTSKKAPYTDMDLESIRVPAPTKRLFRKPQPQPIHPVDDNSTQSSTFSQFAPAYATLPTMNHLSIGSKLIKHIPKLPSRHVLPAVTDLRRHWMMSPATHDDKAKWMALLSFGKRYLEPPRRGGKRHNLTAIIRNWLNRDECDEDTPELIIRRKQRNADKVSVVAAAVSSKIEDGNIKVAIRILTSDDKPAPNSADSLLNLQNKHPRPAAYNHLQPDDNQHNQPTQTSNSHGS